MELDVKMAVLVREQWTLERIAIKPSFVVAPAVVYPLDPQGICVWVINLAPDIATVYKGPI